MSRGEHEGAGAALVRVLGETDAMDLETTVRRRRMVRRFDPDRQVPRVTVERLLDLAGRAPSAGFTQGWDFLVLRSDDERRAFWEAARGSMPEFPDDWVRGVGSAPTLVLFFSNPGAYLDRYAEPDKGWEDRDPARWPVPYWDTDTAMAAMILLLGVVDEGLGALFFGVPPAGHAPVREALAVPEDRRLVGVVAIGHESERVRSPSLRRGRRGLDETVHWGRFGVPVSSAGDESEKMAAGSPPTDGD
jgi:nitroreductase